MSAFRDKADAFSGRPLCPLITQSGHITAPKLDGWLAVRDYFCSRCHEPSHSSPGEFAIRPSMRLMNVEDGPSLGTDFERSGKGATSIFPMLRSIGGKSFRVVGPKLDLCLGQLTLATHDLENCLRSGLTKHYDSVNFAYPSTVRLQRTQRPQH